MASGAGADWPWVGVAATLPLTADLGIRGVDHPPRKNTFGGGTKAQVLLGYGAGWCIHTPDDICNDDWGMD